MTISHKQTEPDSPFFPQSVQLTRNLNSALTLASYQVQSVS